MPSKCDLNYWIFKMVALEMSGWTTICNSNVIRSFVIYNPRDQTKKKHLKLLATSLPHFKWTPTYRIIYIASDKRYNDKLSLIKSYRLHYNSNISKPYNCAMVSPETCISINEVYCNLFRYFRLERGE